MFDFTRQLKVPQIKRRRGTRHSSMLAIPRRFPRQNQHFRFTIIEATLRNQIKLKSFYRFFSQERIVSIFPANLR